MNTSGILLLSQSGIGKQRNPTQSLITIIIVVTNKEDFGNPEFIFIFKFIKNAPSSGAAEFRLFSLHQVIQFIYDSQAFSVSNLYLGHVLVTNFSHLERARNSGSLGCGVRGVMVTFI